MTFHEFNFMQDERYPNRKLISHKIRLVTKFPPLIFLTICTAKKRPILASDQIHNILTSLWSDPSRWVVGRYVVLPDHLHLFAIPGIVDCELTVWIRWWKREVKLRCQELKIDWQKGCFDHRVRSHESYESLWEYMRMNPVNHGLVSSPCDWKFSGEIFQIWG